MSHLDPGTLLIAPPMMRDPNFWRTVVLVCQHGDEGSFGLVLNRPLSMDMSEVIADMSGENLLSIGGPVQQDSLHYLHRHGDTVAEAIQVAGGVHWGGDFDTIRLLVETEVASPRDLRFFVGYAGWTPGQLEAEMSTGGWITCRARDTLVFPEDPKTLWRASLLSMGGEYAFLANFPADPQVN